MLISEGFLGVPVLIFFTIGVIAVTFANADSALTGLTTSICVDMLEIKRYDEKKAKRVRIGVHLSLSLIFIAIMLVFKAINDTSVIDAIYTIASYTYGPLLGLFAFGILFKRRRTWDKIVPYVCVLAPLICFAADRTLNATIGYRFGYELLIINSLLVLLGLLGFSRKNNKE
jgi:peptidoglycan/LPS O-acetylase OafA/YrhL